MPTHLLSLPFELILIILRNLDWTDIVRVRKTCRLLYEASRERAVVQNLVMRYTTTYPRSTFSLERSIALYSTSELEGTIRLNLAANRGWAINVPKTKPPFVPRKQEIRLDHAAKTFCLIEGGRWLLVVRITGSVTYYDLDTETPTKRELIPDLVERRPWTMILVATDRDHSQPVLTVNFAIYTRIWLGFIAEQLQVWRITLVLDENNAGVGLAAKRVTTLQLGPDFSPTAICLCGNYVSWDYEKDGCLNVTTVNWMEAARLNESQNHPSSRPIPIATLKTRNIVHRGPDMPAFRLLPGNFLIIASKPIIKLYDLEMVRITSPCSYLHHPQDESAREVTPHIWETSLHGMFSHSLSKPFFCPWTNTVRFVIYTRELVYGLIIPLTRRFDHLTTLPLPIEKANPEIFQLMRYVSHSEQCGFSSGYHTAVLHTFAPQTVIIRYRWPDEWPEEDQTIRQCRNVGIPIIRTGERPQTVHHPDSILLGIQQKMIPITCKNWSPFTPVMDEGSGRVIYSAQSGKQLVVANFSK